MKRCMIQVMVLLTLLVTLGGCCWYGPCGPPVSETRGAPRAYGARRTPTTKTAALSSWLPSKTSKEELESYRNSCARERTRIRLLNGRTPRLRRREQSPNVKQLMTLGNYEKGRLHPKAQPA